MKKWSIATSSLVVALLLGGYVVGPYLQGQGPAPIVMPKELTSYRDVAKRVLPAVVSIESDRKVQVTRQQVQPRIPQFDDERIPEEFRRFFKDFQIPFKDFEFEVPDRAPRGFGSGFIVDPKGIVLTNYHVVANADKVTVQLYDGRKFVSSDIRGDRKTDLAIIKLDLKGERLPYLEFGDSDAMEIGDRVLAFGAPFGLRGSVTSGIVSAKGRNGLHMNMYEDFLQTDAAINPGNSGGPLVNLEGRVIGINSAIKSHNGVFNGVGLAIASNLAKTIKDALIKDGVVHRGYLGVQVRELEPEVAKRMGLQEKGGVVVGTVFENSPAERGGLKAGDILLSVGSKDINDGKELQSVILAAGPNKKVDIQVLRDGKRLTLPITIEEQPEDFGLTMAPVTRSPSSSRKSAPLNKLGIEVEDLTADLARELGFSRDSKGVVISNVEPGSLAFSAGVVRGMLLRKIDNEPVDSVESARQALNKASLEKGILLQVETPSGGVNYIVIQSKS